MRMEFNILWCILLLVKFCTAWMDERPVLESIDGNLIISSAKDKNITIKLLGKGYFNVQDIDLLKVAISARSSSVLVERWRDGFLRDLVGKIDRVAEVVEGPYGLTQRINLLEHGVDPTANYSGWRPDRPPVNLPDRQIDEATKTAVRTLTNRVRRLETRLRTFISKSRTNQCTNNPCQNGGTCIRIYDGYQCICPTNWEGPSCSQDVNECAIYYGSDLGCQNGATCTNLPGSYQCTCASGWYGVQCTSATAVCNPSDSHRLCGPYGTCVPTGTTVGYTCLCEQGWKAEANDPKCTVDVNECDAPHPPCSTQPLVPCINVPGRFYCGSCPAGYSGNGHYCSDIDECATDNGGCSTVPKVQCINTMGSRICGSCPSGYQGDGVTCIFVGTCRINNGGCHSLATCIENPGYTNVLVECRCPDGFHGDGIGPQGCQPGGAVVIRGPCNSNPCIHGTCLPHGHEFICRCAMGYTGPTCATSVNPCSPNPCQNSGICTVDSAGTVNCECTAAYSGPRCEVAKETCGGVIRDLSGTLTYPLGGVTYQHGLSCAFILATNNSFVLNVTFTKFDLEVTAGCRHDFLQIHDGGNAGSHQIGRFCGKNLPMNGSIISTHNSLYLWFHTDNSIARTGFSLHWNSIQPVCGGELEFEHGTISSPGSPGRYSPNRDCTWHVRVRPGKRIQFHFFTVLIEPHPTCDMDYLEIAEISRDRTAQLGLYCNHTHPPPLTTSGSYAIVHFHSDGFGQDLGFQITYSSVEGTPGCGGVHTADHGVIYSPSEQGSTYRPNMLCEWKIQLPIGEKIKLIWKTFNLEESVICKFDYVQIYEGATVESPTLGRFCGAELPSTMTLDSNVALIIFKSDWSNEKEGFNVQYETACGGIFSESSGVIKSPYYPNHYPSARTCIYEIIQPPGKAISLHIVDMDIEGATFIDCYFDHLEIHDGDNENRTILANLCGNEDNIPTDPIYSTYNYMYIKFETDLTVHGRGFVANYTAIDRGCGGLLKQPEGTIRYPGESGEYGNNEDCIWNIQAPPGHVIQLTWSTFNLEYQDKCGNDYVKVYEEYEGDEAPIGQYCGTKKPPILTSLGRTMTIIFHSDTTITSDGFSANYLFIDASKVCGGHYFKSIGVLKSPGHPNYYPPNRECVWVIEAPNKYQIRLNVEQFVVEDHSRCVFDYLEIRNGGYETSPLIGKFCGDSIPTEIRSLTNQMYIKFVSDSSRGREGFVINWDSSTFGCGGILTGATGDIISPFYPQVYARASDCTWKIAVAAGSRVELMIVDLDLEEHVRCRFDYIEISEERHGHLKNTNRYCGSNHPSALIMESNLVTVRFRSDFSNSGRGFHIKYHTLCSNKIHGFNGVIESPNFPNKYPSSINCSWIIDAPKGNKINLTFSHFALESNSNDVCKYDYLALKEGSDDVANTELGKYCGPEVLPPKVSSTQHQVFIEFVTDEYFTYGGFRLEWAIDGCGGHLNRPEGKFTSPGYPKPYPKDIECEWLIEVDHAHSVEIIFDEIDTEKVNSCSYDKVEIYGGADVSAPLLASFCHATGPVNYTSTTNKMFVKFTSDWSMAGRGFSASYKAVPLTCGGKFQADQGLLHSANYPKNYPNSQNCEWFIQVDKNHAINFTFLDFDIEDTTNCTDDYVKIFDGPTRDDAELGTFCNNQLPPSIISSGNIMLVVMRTDSLISAKGFRAQFERTCGARIVTNETGILSTISDLHLRQTEGTNCSWIIVAADPADHVTLTIFHMDMGSTYEWDDGCEMHSLTVHEGEGSSGPVRGTWCQNKVPPPIISNGNALTVNLATSSYSDDTFQASYSVLNSACGGNYYSEFGTLTSPMYPDSYPTNAECVWILNTAPGNQLSLIFSAFDIELSPNCDRDYLEIREESGVGKLIGVYCGNKVDPVTIDKKLWIKFRSDEVGTDKGFIAEYSFIHGNFITGTRGEIASPLYPHPFKRQTDVTWRVTVDFGSAVRIEFDDFHIENYDDCYIFFTIYDGYDTEAPQIGELCGLVIPEPIQSSSNVVFLKFSGDSIREGNWFHLNWYQVPRATENTNTDLITSPCNEEISLSDFANATHYFTSPGYPTGYATDLRCTWLFTSPPGTHLILRFIHIDLEESFECISDHVAVYSGYAIPSPPPPEAKLLGKYCLANESRIHVDASNVMTVKFNSDVYANGTGFKAVAYSECGGDLSGPSGVIEFNDTIRLNQIRSWNYICEWRVKVRPGRKIVVNIEKIAIDTTNQRCGNYYLMLKNGEGPDSPLLGNGTYCGRTPPETLTTTSNHLYVKAVGSGLHVVYKLTYKEVGLECGGMIQLSSHGGETFSSPNYPNIPPPYSECFWTVAADAGERVSIHFVDRFDLTRSANCESEYVEIRDGGTDTAKLMGKFCSNKELSTMTSTGNYLYVHFYTNVPDPKNGFKATVTTGEVCGGIIRGKRGVITSPNYPQSYGKDVDCTWWVIGPPDHTLKFEFRDLHLPGLRRCENADHVQILEKLPDSANFTSTNTSLGIFCGMSKPAVIETSFNEAIILFRSDRRSYVQFRGFSLNFTASKEACGGELNGMMGEFKSLGYPNPNLRSKYCAWRITVPEGHQVRLDIEDLDNGASGDTNENSFYLGLFNDFGSKSQIKTIQKGTQDRTVSSSTNYMTVSYWASSGHRGLKALFTAVVPAPCGGIKDNLEGSLLPPTSTPFNQSSFFCQWSLKAPEVLLTEGALDNKLTLTITISGIIGRYPGETNSCNYIREVNHLMKYIMVTDSKNTVGMVCGNLTRRDYVVRSPAPLNIVTALNGTFDVGMKFDMKFKWQKCGGILRGPSHTVSTPTDIEYPRSCAWRVAYPDNGEVIRMTFNRLNMGDCEKGYLIVRNGGPMSPEVGKFCGNLKPQNITSSTHELWVEYWAKEAPGDFEFRLDIALGGCGGAIRGSSREITSPGFPAQYTNNVECVWEITAENGYNVGLSFIDRFNLETSPSCINDFVQVFEWNDTNAGSWTPLGKVCGRNVPPVFNATSNRMKVLFRTNANIQGDGFHALWDKNCGGIFTATKHRQTIESPNYPNYYAKNLVCNYTIIAPAGKSILLEFTEFQLELDNMNCRYDNLTIQTIRYGWRDTDSIYCGDNKPVIQSSESPIVIIFKTDAYVQKRGFQFNYFINECGGEITQEEILQPPISKETSQYFDSLNCTWIIRAPADKSISLRFNLFELEYSYRCYFDRLEVYEDSWINSEKMIATLCGNLTDPMPVVKSVGNIMTVMFHSDGNNQHRGFSAEIIFTKSIGSGCGGNINLTSSRSWKTNTGSTYSSFEDCLWTISAKPGKNVKLTITSMDVQNSPNKTVSSNTAPCNGDYLEVRDGKGPFSELIGRYCGSYIPQPIVSSSNFMWIRFYTDGEFEGAGVTANLDLIDSPCGDTMLRIDEASPSQQTKQYLRSPGYPGNYPLGVQCRWIITAPAGQDIHIHFNNIDLEDSVDCLGDRLTFIDKMINKHISEGFGENFIYGGVQRQHHISAMDSHNPTMAYTFCSKWDSYDYYSGSTQMEVILKSTSEHNTKPRKFEMEVGLAGCNRNYTSPQGRIVHKGFTDCQITIEVPPGNTISLYFNELRLYDISECARSNLQIYDGDFSAPLSAKLCGMETPSPIFSTGNKLSLHSTSERGVTWESYDIIYTSTDQGRGCGGKIYNYAGKFTSPMYPNNYRNATRCIWNVSVPRGSKITLDFLAFDIGSGDCSMDYLTINDVKDTDTRFTTYCPGENPSKFHSSTNEVRVTYVTSVNNGGSGWAMHFVSKEQSFEADVDVNEMRHETGLQLID